MMKILFISSSVTMDEEDQTQRLPAICSSVTEKDKENTESEHTFDTPSIPVSIHPLSDITF